MDRLADVPSIPGAGEVGFEDGDVGPPTYFVSHAWKSTVGERREELPMYFAAEACSGWGYRV